MGVIYTDGREGSHSVVMCKPIGRGFYNIQNVPLDQANSFMQQGYYQCESDKFGDVLSEPREQSHGTTVTPTPPPSQPQKLPSVGSPTWPIWFLLLAAIVLTYFIMKKEGRQ